MKTVSILNPQPDFFSIAVVSIFFIAVVSILLTSTWLILHVSSKLFFPPFCFVIYAFLF